MATRVLVGDIFGLEKMVAWGTHAPQPAGDGLRGVRSYVILDRAVPHIDDGLKPVQRRIMHSLRELEDGRYNKVANAVGNTMKYHPHGDASITDALVGLGQKGTADRYAGQLGKHHHRRPGGGAPVHRGAAFEVRAGSGLQSRRPPPGPRATTSATTSR